MTLEICVHCRGEYDGDAFQPYVILNPSLQHKTCIRSVVLFFVCWKFLDQFSKIKKKQERDVCD